MALDKLGVINKALVEYLGERPISSLSEAVKAQRIMNSIWSNDLVDYSLSAGVWDFASRIVKLDNNPSIELQMSWNYAFNIPDDFISLIAIAVDEDFRGKFTQYDIDGSLITSDNSYIYLKYISNDASYGNDLSLWTPAFADYVACLLAYRSSKAFLLSSADKDRLFQDLNRLSLPFAKEKDAQNRPVRNLTRGSWFSSRYSAGRDNSSRDEDRHA